MGAGVLVMGVDDTTKGVDSARADGVVDTVGIVGKSQSTIGCKNRCNPEGALEGPAVGGAVAGGVTLGADGALAPGFAGAGVGTSHGHTGSATAGFSSSSSFI